MSTLLHGMAGWLLLGTLFLVVAGCASGHRMARGGHECPSGFVEYCDVSDQGYRCNCVSRTEIDSALREWQTR
jgi:hypothetical protein